MSIRTIPSGQLNGHGPLPRLRIAVVGGRILGPILPGTSKPALTGISLPSATSTSNEG